MKRWAAGFLSGIAFTVGGAWLTAEFWWSNFTW